MESSTNNINKVYNYSATAIIMTKIITTYSSSVISGKQDTIIPLELLAEEIGDYSAKNIKQCLNGTAKYLSLSSRGKYSLKDKGAIALAELFNGNNSIEEVVLWSQEIGRKGIKAVVEWIENSSVKSFDIYYNDIHHKSNIEHQSLIGDEALIMLVNSGVSRLSVRNQYLNDASAKAIALELKNSNLVTFNLNYKSNIGIVGLRALAKGLQESKIIKFTCDNNNLKTVEAKAILVEIRHITEENGKRALKSVSEFQKIFQNSLTADLKSISEQNLLKATNIIEEYGVRSFADHLSSAGLKQFGKLCNDPYMDTVNKLREIMAYYKSSIIIAPVIDEEMQYNMQFYQSPNPSLGFREMEEKDAVAQSRDRMARNDAKERYETAKNNGTLQPISTLNSQISKEIEKRALMIKV